MNKRPFLMAALVGSAIFLFFLIAAIAVTLTFRGPASFPLGNKVGVIEIVGVINSSKKVNEQLLDFQRNPAIKAIVLRVDSPGGGVGPSQEIYEEVKKAGAKKPVVVSMGGVTASGGYYVACTTNRILANPGTLTGSIGVIMNFTNFQDLFSRVGLKSEVVKSGPYKDVGSPTRQMSAEDRQLLQSLIDDVHDQFVTAVAEGRGLEREKVLAFADGRIMTGRQALAAGMVDQLGNLQDAIRVAGELAGIEGEPDVVYPREEKPGLFDYLIQETLSQLDKGVHGRSQAGLQYLWTGN